MKSKFVPTWRIEIIMKGVTTSDATSPSGYRTTYINHSKETSDPTEFIFSVPFDDEDFVEFRMKRI